MYELCFISNRSSYAKIPLCLKKIKIVNAHTKLKYDKKKYLLSCFSLGVMCDDTRQSIHHRL